MFIDHSKLNNLIFSEKQILHIDMDKVMCDFEKRYNLIKQKSPDIKYPQSQIGFFRDLKPIKDACESIHKLKEKYDIWFLTRPSYMNIHCYSEKAEWILNHLGFEYQKRMIIMPNKSLAIGHYLIDDSTRDGQTEFIGEHIHFGSEKFPDWESVVKYLM